MAVSKRLRFEIFRRDNHTCRYCGASAPDVTLEPDHVVPVTLGGTDEPSNLVTACQDCNSGKTSTSPDSPLVEDVEQDALRWSKAMEKAADVQAHHRDRIGEVRDAIRLALEAAFLGGEMEVCHEPRAGWHWSRNPDRTYPYVVKLRNVYTDEYRAIFMADSEDEVQRWADRHWMRTVPDLPHDWDASIPTWIASGVDERDFDDAAEVAARAKHVAPRDRYRYFCGVIWRKIEDRQRIARDLLKVEEGE